MVVWIIVNVEEWSIEGAMPRTVLSPPMGQPLMPDLPNWAWHEYGMRVGFWRLLECLKEYDAAVTYSKNGFFETLLAGVDREKVAIVYTSDHGQNVKQGVLPHCATVPEQVEFAVPLLAFLPQALAQEYPAPEKGGHSASQIFPTTLAWMGYDPAIVTETYDNILQQPTKNFVWFGRAVIPLRPGDRIEVTKSRTPLVD